MTNDIKYLREDTPVSYLIEAYWERGWTNILSMMDSHTLIFDLANHKDKLFKDLSEPSQQFVKTWLANRTAIDFDSAMKIYEYLKK